MWPGEILDFLLGAGFSQLLFFSCMLVGVAYLLEGMHVRAYCCPVSPEKGQARLPARGKTATDHMQTDLGHGTGLATAL